MQTLFGFDLSTAQKVMVASVVILVLLVLLGLFVRQIQGGRLRMKSQGGGRTRQPRLGIVDTHDLDRQRQLVLIRRDNVEHLIMIGGPSDVVVETNIVRAGRAPAPLSFDQGQGERPPAYEPSQPEAARADATRMEPPAPDVLPPLPMRASPAPATDIPPAPAPEQASPRAAPRSAAAEAETALALGAAIGAAVGVTANSASAAPEPAPAPTVSPPPFTRDHAPSPTASAVELDAMTRQLEEALKRPFSAVRPAGSAPAPSVEPQDRAPPPASRAPEVRTEPRTPPAFLTESRLTESRHTESRRAAEPQPEPEPQVDAPASEPVAVPAASARPVPMPIDVEAELEFALGLKPKRTDTKPQSQEPQSQEAQAPADMALDDMLAAEPEPMVNSGTVAGPAEDAPAQPPVSPASEGMKKSASAMPIQAAAAAPVIEEPAAKASEPALFQPSDVSPPEPDADEAAASEPAVDEPQSPAEPSPETEAAAPKDDRADVQPAAIDPFSVDAIEAEFARLLGRDPKSKS